MWATRVFTVRTDQTISSTKNASDFPSILPFSNHCVGTVTDDSVQWYEKWVYDQVQQQPEELFSTISKRNRNPETRWTVGFEDVWQEIARYMTTSDETSIDDVAIHLVENEMIDSTSTPESVLTTRNLIFAIIGWQTMLYEPDICSCPATQLAIDSQMGVHQGQAHMSLKQSHFTCKKNMKDFLLGFGMLLPPRNFSAFESSEDKTAFNELTTVRSTDFNAHFLTSLGGVNIGWVDSLPCHLEFDADSNTLFLFRYPSFCLVNLPSGKSTTTAHRSVIHACAAPYAGSTQWATEDEVTQMLRETILSYRLLFGQSRASRQLFRSLTPFDAMAYEDRDLFLTALCVQKHPRTYLKLSEREVYDLRRDFPVLRGRLAILISHLASRKPRTWKDLWVDKRDSASWLTFWAVIIIGGLGILLSLLQAVLQIVQIATQK